MTQSNGTTRTNSMTVGDPLTANVLALDEEHVALVRLSAAIAAGDEVSMRAEIARSAVNLRPEWVEEVILQSYLFAGFPRALNAAREWRRLAPTPTQGEDAADPDRGAEWTKRGEATCAAVYGSMYEKLRRNEEMPDPPGPAATRTMTRSMNISVVGTKVRGRADRPFPIECSAWRLHANR